jgi:hypothetical protein
MLRGWNKTQNQTVVLPDVEDHGNVEEVREHTRQGEICCPTCRALLWLRTGEIRIWHFAHRTLSDCPQGRVSEAVLRARVAIYRFFQNLISTGHLSGEVVMEPGEPRISDRLYLDLLLKPQGSSPVAIPILESSMPPEARRQFQRKMEEGNIQLRTVFLATRLKQPEPDRPFFHLDTTQRDFRRRTPYDQSVKEAERFDRSLHFFYPDGGSWKTLRALHLCHAPQVYRAGAVRESSMANLLWNAEYSDWTHEGEKADHEAWVEETNRAAGLARISIQPSPSPRSPPPLVLEALPVPPSGPEAAWQSLVCVGCGKATGDWTNASPGWNQCVCRACFAAGVRLP